MGGFADQGSVMVIKGTTLALGAVAVVKVGAAAIQVPNRGGCALDGTSAALLEHGSDIVKAH